MKIKKTELQQLIENYLFESIETPKTVKAKGYTYELPGDGAIKIIAKGSTKKNIVILPKEMSQFQGKAITKSMERNKKYYEGIKEDIIGAETKAEKYFSKKESGDNSKSETPEDRERKNIKKYKKMIDEGLSSFLSNLLSYMHDKFKFSDAMIKALTGGDTTFTSKNVSYKNKAGTSDGNIKKALKNPFVGAQKNPTSTEKTAYNFILSNLALMIRYGDLNNLQLDNTIVPNIAKVLGSKPEGLLMLMRTGLGRLDTAGDSLEQGQGGEPYTDLKKFAELELSSAFFLPDDLK